jgi:hypothetical protein
MKGNIRDGGVSSLFSDWRPFWHLRRSTEVLLLKRSTLQQPVRFDHRPAAQ